MSVFVEAGSMAGVGVEIEVGVAVKGAGDGNRPSVVDAGEACGANSTREIDKAPAINPIDTRAVKSALKKPREPCITSFP